MTPGLLAQSLVGFSLALAAGCASTAELYKWVDQKGVVTYGEKPPANTPATPVNTDPGAVVETGGRFNRKSESEKPLVREGSAAASATPAAPAASPPASARGMEFDVYIRLQKGMSEGELLQRAGRPDHESVENVHRFIVKTYYYFPTTSNPYTTVVTLRGGRIQDVDRVKKF